MNADIEKLIKLAAEGGSISDYQRRIILRKVQELGEDPDEAQFLMKIAVREAKEESSRKLKEEQEKDRKIKEEEERKNEELKEQPLKNESQIHMAPQVEQIVYVQQDPASTDPALIREKGLLDELDKMENMLAKYKNTITDSGTDSKKERKLIEIELVRSIRMAKAKYGNDSRFDSMEKALSNAVEEAKRNDRNNTIIGLIVIILGILAYFIWK